MAHEEAVPGDSKFSQLSMARVSVLPFCRLFMSFCCSLTPADSKELEMDLLSFQVFMNASICTHILVVYSCLCLHG